MELFAPVPPEAASSLAMALVITSQAPLLLLDGDLVVIAASNSFCRHFQLPAATTTGTGLLDLGEGEWNLPRLESLLRATIAGDAAIQAYEMDLERDGRKPCRLVLNAHKLDYFNADTTRIVLAVTDAQAEALVFARTTACGEALTDADCSAAIDVVLRSPDDKGTTETTGGIILQTILDQYGVLPPYVQADINAFIPTQP